MIPKKISFYWDCDNMSWMRLMTLKSFRVLNPDWEIILYLDFSKKITTKPWNDSTLQDFCNFKGNNFFNQALELDIKIKELRPGGQRIFNSSEHEMAPSQKSCLFRWDLLANEAGFYSDFDILYIKPIENYYNQVKNCDIITCYKFGYFSIGFLGSSGNSKFFKDIFENTLRCFDKTKYQTAGVLNNYNWLKKISGIEQASDCGIDYWKILENNYPGKIYNNRMELVYNWHWNQMEEVFLKLHRDVPEDCIGIHWYGGNDISQKFNNILTDFNYQKYNNTFAYFARRVLELD